MVSLKFVPFAVKQILRRRARTLLTIAGVATAMFLFCAIQSMQQGMKDAAEANAAETTLIVYRENRFCPFTSKLPERYEGRIAAIQGVKSVLPMKIVVSNCRASLDVITFRGVPPEKLSAQLSSQFRVISGSIADWNRRSDAALIGETMAIRRGLKVGDRFDANGVVTYIAAIVDSDEAQDKNTAYVHLEFLQRGSAIKSLGIVTEFIVKINDPKDLESVAQKIDAEFAHDTEPTQTRSEKAFVARAAGDLLELIGFTRWLGLGCVVAVLALVANTVVMSVQDRVREHAVLQTLGFKGNLIARLIVLEGAIVSFAGGLVGAGLAVLALRWGGLSLSTEGVNINFSASPRILITGLAVSLALGIVAGLVPAWQASRRDIVEGFRAV
ncbi:MAG TPA: FtsX-like permease family protein [Planctomycetota bacterium]|nr:FtsX-like permease family protein [Planctomycetota bacterium]